MSEKPVAPIKTFARYEPDTVYIGTGEYVAECVRADDGDYYLAADVDAALEAAREDAERYRWLRNHYGLGSLHIADRYLMEVRCAKYSGAAQGLDVTIDAAIAAEKKKEE